MEFPTRELHPGQDILRCVTFGISDVCSYGTSLLFRTRFVELEAGESFPRDWGIQDKVPESMEDWMDWCDSSQGRPVIWLEGTKSVIFPTDKLPPGTRGLFVIPSELAGSFSVAGFTPWEEEVQIYSNLAKLSGEKTWKVETLKRYGILSEARNNLVRYGVLKREGERFSWSQAPRRGWEKLVSQFTSVRDVGVGPNPRSYEVNPFPWAVEINARVVSQYRFCIFLDQREFRGIRGCRSVPFRQRKSKFQVFADSLGEFEGILGWKPPEGRILSVAKGGGARGSQVVIATLNLQKKASDAKQLLHRIVVGHKPDFVVFTETGQQQWGREGLHLGYRVFYREKVTGVTEGGVALCIHRRFQVCGEPTVFTGDDIDWIEVDLGGFRLRGVYNRCKNPQTLKRALGNLAPGTILAGDFNLGPGSMMGLELVDTAGMGFSVLDPGRPTFRGPHGSSSIDHIILPESFASPNSNVRVKGRLTDHHLVLRNAVVGVAAFRAARSKSQKIDWRQLRDYVRSGELADSLKPVVQRMTEEVGNPRSLGKLDGLLREFFSEVLRRAERVLGTRTILTQEPPVVRIGAPTGLLSVQEQSFNINAGNYLSKRTAHFVENINTFQPGAAWRTIKKFGSDDPRSLPNLERTMEYFRNNFGPPSESDSPPDVQPVSPGRTFNVRTVQGDGACLFRAVAVALGNGENEALWVRQIAVEGLWNLDEEAWESIQATFRGRQSDNPLQEVIEAASGDLDTFKRVYCGRMTRSEAWGGEPELVALSKRLNRPIHVWYGTGWTRIGEGGDPIFLNFDSRGKHYSALIPGGALEGESREGMVVLPDDLDPGPNVQTTPGALPGDIRGAILDTIRNGRRGVSAGPDGIPGDLLRTDPDSWADLLFAILGLVVKTGQFPPCLLESRVVPLFKGGKAAIKNGSLDATDPEKYRPIGIGNFAYNVLAKVVNKRIKPQTEQWLNPMQSGFTSDRSTVGNHLIFRDIKDFAGQKCALLLDIRKAYDSIDRSILMRKLGILREALASETQGSLGWAFDFIKAAYSGTSTATVLTSSGYTEPIRIGRGVRQGDPLSPLLFNVYLNDLIKALDLNQEADGLPTSRVSSSPRLEFDGNGTPCVAKVEEWSYQHIKVIAYADDIIVYAPSLKELESQLKVAEKWAAENRMEFSALKSTLIANFNVPDKARPRVCGQPVSLGDPNKGTYYLGLPITFGEGYKQAEYAITQKFKKRTHTALPLLSSPHLSMGAKRKIYKMMVRASIEHAIYIPSFSDTFWENLDKRQGVALAAMAGLRGADRDVLRLDLDYPSVRERCKDLGDAFLVKTLAREKLNRNRVTSLLASIAVSKTDDSVLDLEKQYLKEKDSLYRRKCNRAMPDEYVSYVSFPEFLEKKRASERRSQLIQRIRDHCSQAQEPSDEGQTDKKSTLHWKAKDFYLGLAGGKPIMQCENLWIRAMRYRYSMRTLLHNDWLWDREERRAFGRGEQFSSSLPGLAGRKDRTTKRVLRHLRKALGQIVQIPAGTTDMELLTLSGKWERALGEVALHVKTPVIRAARKLVETRTEVAIRAILRGYIRSRFLQTSLV